MLILRPVASDCKSRRGVGGTNTIQYKKDGVALSLVPFSLGQSFLGHVVRDVRLRYVPEIS